MTQPVTYFDSENIDDNAKKYILNYFILSKTNQYIYENPENFSLMDLFFEEHKNMYRILYRREDQHFHMKLYILLSVHIGIDTEKIEEALLDGDILDFAYDALAFIPI